METRRRAAPSAGQVSVLEYWHKIEFFIHYDLQREVLDDKDAEWSVRLWSAEQLADMSTRALWEPPLAQGKKLQGFNVYLGVFDKRELADVVCRVVNSNLSPDEALDQEERAELEGLTCCASIWVDADGTPALGAISVSTVPWALGRIARQGLDSLDFDAFTADLQSLKLDVKTLRASRHGIQAASDPGAWALTAAELTALLRILDTWSGHAPAARAPGAPRVVVQAKFKDDRTEPPRDTAKQKPKPAASADDDAEEDPASQDDVEVTILNSFFAEDLALATASIQQGTAGAALRGYLTPGAEADRVDLYRPEGLRHIAEQLRPRHLNGGHWPDKPAHAMSLMQQFAINSVFEQLATEGIFSVNGPPGTGKTTLLRDIFAENIVRRARALNTCSRARDAFREHITVSFDTAKDCSVSVLREELSGFEMVVASSNNAAVHNISKDLPRSRSLGKPPTEAEAGAAWREPSGEARVGYLQPVARNLLERNRKGGYDLPQPDEEGWGLIACALGNKGNRKAFLRGIIQDGASDGHNPRLPKGFDPARHQSLWTWRTRYAGPSFDEAKRLFAEADAGFGQWVEKLDRYARLRRELDGATAESFVAVASRGLAEAMSTRQRARDAFEDVDEEWQLSGRQLELLRTEETLIEKKRPGWWARLRDGTAKAVHDAQLAANRHQQGEWIRRRYTSEPRRVAARRALDQAKDGAGQAEAALAARQVEWQTATRQLHALASEFPQATHPRDGRDLDGEAWQIHGVWHSELLNAKRSVLFVAALQLHEAWLAEVLQPRSGFGGNVVALCNLLDGHRPSRTSDVLALWQSLFMIVPVVSSTFASFARQFRGLGPGSLGWLFIDEAGQAVPQAAVGAIWRARRAVVVGDPLQIEPVFTVPIRLIEALRKPAGLPEDREVAPHKVSVQSLADQANALGAHVGANGLCQWVGSPLRVHRRCVDPMFSIANDIAYDGKMIFYDPENASARRPPADSLDLGPSAWVHAPGLASHRQVVGSQIELVQQVLAALYARTGRLPPVYVISPFKRIKQALIDSLSKPAPWQQLAGMQPPRAKDLTDWCKGHVGTVHTFQGKEESIVWLVLGCDERSIGAAHWAASKPNLLNVAVTRARHRCFLIGDAALWGRLQNFAAADDSRLPRITPQQFLQRVTAP